MASSTDKRIRSSTRLSIITNMIMKVAPQDLQVLKSGKDGPLHFGLDVCGYPCLFPGLCGADLAPIPSPRFLAGQLLHPAHLPCLSLHNRQQSDIKAALLCLAQFSVFSIAESLQNNTLYSCADWARAEKAVVRVHRCQPG